MLSKCPTHSRHNVLTLANKPNLNLIIPGEYRGDSCKAGQSKLLPGCIAGEGSKTTLLRGKQQFPSDVGLLCGKRSYDFCWISAGIFRSTSV